MISLFPCHCDGENRLKQSHTVMREIICGMMVFSSRFTFFRKRPKSDKKRKKFYSLIPTMIDFKTKNRKL